MKFQQTLVHVFAVALIMLMMSPLTFAKIIPFDADKWEIKAEASKLKIF